MNKEYHVFTTQHKNHEQAFVFEVSREDQGVQLNELWLITCVGQSEVKTCIKFDNIIHKIMDQVGGNVPDQNVEKLTDMFDDVLSDEKKQELLIEKLEKDELRTYSMNPEELLDAAFFSEIMHDQHGNIQEIIQDITNSKKN